MYKMKEKEAIKLLKEWAEELEVNTDSKDFAAAVEELKISVRKENLTYDAEERVFKYNLFFPIQKKDESEKISLVNIKSTDMDDTRVVQDYKDSQKVDQSIAMIAESTGLDLGFAGRIHGKDVSRINAVLTVFLT